MKRASEQIGVQPIPYNLENFELCRTPLIPFVDCAILIECQYSFARHAFIISVHLIFLVCYPYFSYTYIDKFYDTYVCLP